MPDISRVSVVVMTRDRRESLLRALGELHDRSPRVPVIVVDNGSADGTPAAVAARFPDVRVIALQENRGATARNAGVAAARTPYVAFSDDDSWWASGALDRAADLLDDVPRLGLVAARVLVGPEERPDPMSAHLAGSPPGGRPGPAGPADPGLPRLRRGRAPQRVPGGRRLRRWSSSSAKRPLPGPGPRDCRLAAVLHG